MKVLISPISVEEAMEVYKGGADIVDIKNVKEGSLGANFPWIIKKVVSKFSDKNVQFSATLGDLSFKPGTASLAALGAAVCGVHYVKAGLKDIASLDEGIDMMNAIVRSCRGVNRDIRVVAASYADYRKFGGISPESLITIAAESGSDVALVDTAIKDGSTLFDVLERDEIEAFVSAGQKNGLEVALAGSVQYEHMDMLHEIKPDIVGVRGAVCQSRDRSNSIVSNKVAEFVQAARLQVSAMEAT